MTREELTVHIRETYGVEPDHPWEDDNIVFRHPGNAKWFALIMSVPARRLGLETDGAIDIMNIKCEQILSASLMGTTGFFPAYHMNKSHWVSLNIGVISREEITELLDFSFALTEPKRKRKTAPPQDFTDI